jgi:hypothetical protein
MTSLQRTLNSEFGREVCNIRESNIKKFTTSRAMKPEDLDYVKKLRTRDIRGSELTSFADNLLYLIQHSWCYNPQAQVENASDDMLRCELMVRESYAYLGGVAHIYRDKAKIKARHESLMVLVGSIIEAEKAVLSNKKRKTSEN